MIPAVHPGRLLRRELQARALSANITADTAVRLGRYFGNSAQFWLDLQSQYDIAIVEKERGPEIARRVRPADAA
jgi:plasmid maintenance system antidote protein VapI